MSFNTEINNFKIFETASKNYRIFKVKFRNLNKKFQKVNFRF